MRHKIVLVEDDQDISLMLTKILTTAGYGVQVLNEGRDILEPGFELPSLFILDNFMPSINGIALCKFLKVQERTRSIPVILISGDPQIKQRALQAGAFTFLEKPFKSNELLEKIKLLLPNQVLVPFSG